MTNAGFGRKHAFIGEGSRLIAQAFLEQNLRGNKFLATRSIEGFRSIVRNIAESR